MVWQLCEFMIFLCTLLRHLSDLNKDNALNLDEFCIAMHLVVAMRHGLELPLTLPTVLLPEKSEGTYGILCAIAKLNGYELILNVGDCVVSKHLAVKYELALNELLISRIQKTNEINSWRQFQEVPGKSVQQR